MEGYKPMSRIRPTMAVFLLVWGGLLLATQFAPARNLTSITTADSCHDKSGPPLEKAPQKHDCCAVGHLHATVMNHSITAEFGFAGRAVFRDAKAIGHDSGLPASQLTIDTGPPQTAVPIRI